MRLVNKSAILCFMFSLSAGAQTANLGLSQTKSVFAKMSAEKAADHALRSKAGQCTATRLPGASNVYTLRWNEGSKRHVERFGRILPQMFPRSEIFLQQAPQQVNNKKSEIEKFFKELKNNLLLQMNLCLYLLLFQNLRSIFPTISVFVFLVLIFLLHGF